MANTYYLLETAGVKYLVINLEFGPRMAVIRWAGRICKMYPDHRGIVNTHAYVDPDGSIMDETSRYSPTRYGFARTEDVTNGRQLYDGLIKRYPNIFMVLSGHNGTDDVVMRRDIGDYGNTITSVLIDVQVVTVDGGSIGEDLILLMRFNEREKRIAFCYYSPAHDKCYNVQN